MHLETSAAPGGTKPKDHAPHISSSSLPDGSEVGRIRLDDGTLVKYWFRSHHLSDDMGGTLFESDSCFAVFQRWGGVDGARRQHFLYLAPLPQGHGSLRRGW